jgi:hypothetical protein
MTAVMQDNAKVERIWMAGGYITVTVLRGVKVDLWRKSMD